MIKFNHQSNTIQNAVDLLISSKIGVVRDTTIKTYTNLFKCLSSYIDFNRELDESACLELERKVRQADISETTKNTYLRNWKVLVKAQNDPSLPIPVIRKVDTAKDTYTQSEIETMLRTPKSADFCTFRNWLIILLLIDTGARNSTIRGIRVRDIDLDRQQILIRNTKNGHPIILCFGKFTAVQLKKYLTVRNEDDLLFCDAWGNELTEGALRQGVEKYLRKLGIEGNIHKFRHTFAKRMLLDEGIDPFTLMKMLGHNNITVTLNYCNLFNADVIKKYSSPVDKNTRHKISF